MLVEDFTVETKSLVKQLKAILIAYKIKCGGLDQRDSRFYEKRLDLVKLFWGETKAIWVHYARGNQKIPLQERRDMLKHIQDALTNGPYGNFSTHMESAIKVIDK